jgi:Xaa-Pro aminopeptidase
LTIRLVFNIITPSVVSEVEPLSSSKELTMFEAKIYIERRDLLKKQMDSGLLLFLGNDQSPANYPDNHYPFRQDSPFLYFFGLDFPSLAAVIDIDNGSETVFGNDPTIETIVWTGTQPTLKSKCQKTGIADNAPLDRLDEVLQKAIRQKRKIHFLPPYRPEHLIKLENLLRIHHSKIIRRTDKGSCRTALC